MSCLELMARSILLALLISGAAAHAETKQAPVKLAPAAPPAPAPRSPALVESPRATDQDAPAASPAGHTNWWPWALIAVAAAGVGALVFLSSGRDPACPGGRTCQ